MNDKMHRKDDEGKHGMIDIVSDLQIPYQCSGA